MKSHRKLRKRLNKKRRTVKKVSRQQCWPFKYDAPVPPSLQKIGLTKRCHNVPPGSRIHVPGKLLAEIFKDELIEAFSKPLATPDNEEK